MRPKTLKVVISTSDIAAIENCSPRTASQKMNDIKAFFNKIGKRYKITFTEYSKYSGVPCEEFAPYR